MPSKKKKYNARFPPARIKKIMQTDEEVGKVAATVPVIISRALELFIESLILQASQTTLSKKARTLSASHLKQTIQSEKKYDFLRELVANIPDHQTEEDGGADSLSAIEHQDKSNLGAVKRPCGRPRKARDPSAAAQKKERKRKQVKVESSEDSESDGSEETDDAVEDSEGEDGASCSSSSIGSVPSTSSGALLMPQSTSVPTVPPYSGIPMYPTGGVTFQGFSDGAAPPYSWSLQGPGPIGFPQMPVPMIRAGLRRTEDDDYDT